MRCKCSDLCGKKAFKKQSLRTYAKPVRFLEFNRPLAQAWINYKGTRYNWRMSNLSPSAQKIQELLTSLGYNYAVIEHVESTRTAQEAAQRAGCELGQIVKSLIFQGKTSGKPILVLTSGANRVDEKRISEYTGEPIRRADADFVRTVSGYAIGGVPPIGHAQKMETYLDEDFLQYQVIWAAAGTPNAIFELTPSDLEKMTNGKTVALK